VESVPGDGWTGGRWWYVWGELREGQAVNFDGDARGLAVKVRRIFRRWYVGKVRERLVKRAQGRFAGAVGAWEGVEQAIQRIAEKEFAKLRKGGRFKFLGRGGGFLLMASPDVLEQCLAGALNMLSVSESFLEVDGKECFS
jgi:hypothetical protein